eukprot:Blabericola_migrator_1__2859@NODE_1819_length_3739_cov_174_502723_g1142_i1_p2_GENE_NODE_1819_length_3739_cov_174_502723_g1142_i1NODE_1819_length_3739_cov_174_502723_g1142_i1_p2_ORF_typecomplete_len195_score45_63C2/PF00168_30/8_5e07_NODE_1819_length_3739_cov_174_502723_g1142_i127163300
MVKIAFHNEKMRKEFKNEKAMPATLRARFYVLRAMALINPLNVTATGETLAEDVALARPLNPYLVFSFGSSRVENLRGSAKTATSNPKFHWVQELDIKNPEEMHVEIAVWSREAGNGENDLFLGSTLIELEQRWQSKEYRKAVENQSLPTELRALKLSPDASKPTGTLQLWTDLLLPWRAQDLPRFELVEPQPG